MPGVYKKKECPVCKIEHRKRGIYCSQSCANKNTNSIREVSDTHRERTAESMREYHKTPEGIATASVISRARIRRAENDQKIKNGEYVLQEDDWFIEIPDLSEDDGFHL